MAGETERSAQTYRIGERDLRVIGLDDLIRIKQHIARPKDRESLAQLLAVKRLGERGSPDN